MKVKNHIEKKLFKYRPWVSLGLIVMLSIFIQQIFIPAAIAQEKWWQRENPKQATDQRINPAYLEKKRELETAQDQLTKDLKAEASFRSLGQNTLSLQKAASSSRNKVGLLEHELSRIPMYAR